MVKTAISHSLATPICLGRYVFLKRTLYKNVTAQMVRQRRYSSDQMMT